MKYLKYTSLSIALAGVLFVPTLTAQAQTTYTNTASLLAQIQLLKAQLATIEQQLLLRGATVPAYTVPVYAALPGTPLYNYNTVNYYINRIEVSFSGSTAQVRVVFNNGNTQFYALQAYNTSDVAQMLAPELNLSPATILPLITQVTNNSYNYNYGYNYNSGYNNSNNYNYNYSYNNTNLRTVDVTFTSNDADVTVRFQNGTTDRFMLRNEYGSQSQVISDIASRYNENTNAVRNIITFNNTYNNGNNYNYNNISSISVNFSGNDAYVVVRYRNGNTTDQFTINSVYRDQNSVINNLASRYNMSTGDIRNVISFN